MDNMILIGIIVLCVAFILICFIKGKPQLVINASLRAIVGTAGIYLLNFLLSSNGYSIHVGVNEITILTNGVLGLPGFIMLYGLAAYYSFR